MPNLFLNNMSGLEKSAQFSEIDGSAMRIALVVATWNMDVTGTLEKWCVKALEESGVKTENILVQYVPGSFELPFVANELAKSGDYDAVIPIGCLVKGETMHFEYIADAVSHGVMRVGLDTGVPTIFGVLTCLTEEQAAARAQDNTTNHGYGWGKTAVEMVAKTKNR